LQVDHHAAAGSAMSSNDGTRFADGLADTLAPLGPVAHRRFFGGRGIVCGEVQFAMIIEGVLYLRVDADLAGLMQARGAQPFVYGTRRRNVEVYSYYCVPEEILDDEALLIDWARRSLQVARLHWKPRKPKARVARALKIRS
jgi:DNA transformation protein